MRTYQNLQLGLWKSEFNPSSGSISKFSGNSNFYLLSHFSNKVSKNDLAYNRLVLQKLDKKLKSTYKTRLINKKKNDIEWW